MIFKKQGKEIFGVAFTAKEQKAIDDEIKRQADAKMSEILHSLEPTINAELLWFFHRKLGYGQKRLIRTFQEFRPCMQELTDHYEMPEESAGFVTKEKLKDIGVDIDALMKEESD